MEQPDAVTIGGVGYRIVADARDGQWRARAQRVDTGERFGIEWAGATEQDARASLVRWLEWQQEHAVALEALQAAEREYHRTIAGSAFASPTEGPSPVEMQKESLDAVEEARTRLDEVRARRPQ